MIPVQLESVKTLLLDMDGTLLDLAFDNYFWRELVPLAYGERQGWELAKSKETLYPIFMEMQGSLEWYCVDYWSERLGLDITALKQQIAERVCLFDGVRDWLDAMPSRGIQRILTTNCHPKAVKIKLDQTNLDHHLDSVVSSHDYGYAKEHPEFWVRFWQNYALEPEHCLMIDDSIPVLNAAKAAGVGQVLAINHPDSSNNPNQGITLPQVARITELQFAD